MILCKRKDSIYVYGEKNGTVHLPSTGIQSQGFFVLFSRIIKRERTDQRWQNEPISS